MDVFGPAWADHVRRVGRNWRGVVTDEDIVLVAGDISWAMTLEEAAPDLEWLSTLPGEKVLVKGNHDYWWSGIGKVRSASPGHLHFIQNSAVTIGSLAATGTRLWDFPEIRWPLPPGAEEVGEAVREAAGPKRGAPADDEKIRARELERLRLGLSRLPDAPLRVVLLHYPPVGEDGEPTVVTRILDEYGVDLCVFGHLHALGETDRPGADCRIGRTRYVLTACDWLDCHPKIVAELSD
jgi:hypothetical protein